MLGQVRFLTLQAGKFTLVLAIHGQRYLGINSYKIRPKKEDIRTSADTFPISKYKCT
jgi:hypothetical protein